MNNAFSNFYELRKKKNLLYENFQTRQVRSVEILFYYNII